jgi:glycosyltransferase involved in cell wall biosynthesis
MPLDASEMPERRMLFLRLGSRPIPRVIRMMALVRELQISCVFVGALREPGLPRTDSWDGFEVMRIGRPFPLVNGRRPRVYISGVFSYWVAAMRLMLALRPAAVHASDIETAIPSIVAGRLLGFPVVYNIHDNLAMRYSVPRWVASVLNVIEGIAILGASACLVPEPFRRDALPSWARRRVTVVRNSPDDPGFAVPEVSRDRLQRVLFAGWLDAGRGLRELLDLAQSGRMHLVVAGDGDQEIQERLARTKNVEYLGFCTHSQIVAETAKCAFVAAFYNPQRVINRFAASNKIAEALAVGRPVLTNVELVVTPTLLAAGVAIAVPYVNICGVADRIDALVADREEYLAMCARARRLFESDYDPAVGRRASLAALSSVGLSKW